jgi:NAD+ diphosphatase
LNRVSFLRTDYAFLSAALTHETTRFLLFKDLNPLTKTPQDLRYASYAEVKSFLGSDPFSQPEPDVI